MYSPSLRNKIFILVVAALAGLALTVMVATRQTVTQGVLKRERHAIKNVMELVKQEAETRWGNLIDHKVATVRHARTELMQTGALITTTLEYFESFAQKGAMSEDRARQLASNWINSLQLEGKRIAFIFNTEEKIIASGEKAMVGTTLSMLRDFKGRPLAASVLRDSRNSGDAFALYRSPGMGPAHLREAHSPRGTEPVAATLGEVSDIRYGYFAYFRPWNWVIAVTDSADHVLNQFQKERAQMERSVRETLAPLTLADSGFVYIVSDDGRTIVPPPPSRANVLEAQTPDGRKLKDALQAQPVSPRLKVRVRARREMWLIDSVYFSPLRWTIVAAVPEADLNAPARRLVQDQALIFGTMLFIALCCAWAVAARIVRPLETLAAYARTIPEQSFEVDNDIPPHVAALSHRRRDEVGRLADAFAYMSRRLQDNVRRLMLETTARERFESELNIARAIQLGLLPVPLSASAQERVDLHAVMRPAKEVGGDLYDYFAMSDGKLCVVIGDVSDKGVPAALFMAITRTLIRATSEDEVNPAVIVQRVNNRLAENNPNLMFVTLLLGVLDMGTGEFCWVNAGHIPPLIINESGSVRTLHGHSGPACGVQSEICYTTHVTRLARGEVLVAYSDGITECANEAGEQYGDAKLYVTLSGSPGSAASISQRLLQDLDSFSSAAAQADDITLLVVRRP
jgi:sigma-B regulation protein RsbU (phosphoserine phosphatase)